MPRVPRSTRRDDVLWNEQAAPTSQWASEEAVDSIIYLEIPTNLQPGEYDLRLVVYDFATHETDGRTGRLGGGEDLG